MEAIAFVLGFVVLGALALRYGQDSREGIRSQEHEFAARGLTWADLAADRHAPMAAAGLSPKPRRPTLGFIERPLAATAGTLTGLPDAVGLEARARDLTTDLWRDTAWTTGIVPEAAFDRVLAELAPDPAAAPALPPQPPAAVVDTVEPAPAEVEREQPVEAPEGGTIFGRAASPLTA